MRHWPGAMVGLTALRLKVIHYFVIDAHNENPKPYKWVKSSEEVLASVKRFCQKPLAGTSDSGD